MYDYKTRPLTTEMLPKEVLQIFFVHALEFLCGDDLHVFFPSLVTAPIAAFKRRVKATAFPELHHLRPEQKAGAKQILYVEHVACGDQGGTESDNGQ